VGLWPKQWEELSFKKGKKRNKYRMGGAGKDETVFGKGKKSNELANGLEKDPG